MAEEAVNILNGDTKYKDKFHLQWKSPVKSYGVMVATNTAFTIPGTDFQFPAGVTKGAAYLLVYEWDLQNLDDITKYTINREETQTEGIKEKNGKIKWLPAGPSDPGEISLSNATKKNLWRSFSLAKAPKTTRLIHVDAPNIHTQVKDSGLLGDPGPSDAIDKIQLKYWLEKDGKEVANSVINRTLYRSIMADGTVDMHLMK